MAYNREKFKSNQEAAAKAKAALSSGYSKINRHTDHKKENGEHVYRIMPTENGYPYLPIKQSWMEVMADKYEDGEVVGKELAQRPIPIATVHGRGIGATVDVVEEYIKLVLKKADNLYPRKDKLLKADRDKYLTPIYGSGSGKNYKGGINPKGGWICYAKDKNNVIAALELNQPWHEDMSKLTSKWTSDDNLVVDIFGEIDKGFRLVIVRSEKKLENGGKKVEYKMETEDVKIAKLTLEKYFEETFVTDEDLMALEELTDLFKVYGDSTYKKRHLTMALDGLKNIDKKNDYGVYNSEEFIKIVESVSELFENDDEDENDDSDEDNSVSDESTTNSEQSKERSNTPPPPPPKKPTPPPPPPKKKEEVKVNGYTYDDMVSAGWTDDALLDSEYKILVPNGGSEAEESSDEKEDPLENVKNAEENFEKSDTDEVIGLDFKARLEQIKKAKAEKAAANK